MTMSYKQIVNEHKKLIIQRWFYALIGILTMIPVILFTLGQIRYIKKDNNEFAFYILLLFHSGCVIYSIISTALFCRVTDALLTTLTILFLSIYTGIHFYIRFLFDYHHLKEDFTIITFRLGFVLIMLIILLPWTNIMAHSYRTMFDKQANCSCGATFSWLLNLDSILMVSLLILTIRSQADFNRSQLLLLSIGVPLIFLWLIIGKFLANKKSSHWTIWMLFYISSLIQIFYLTYIIYSSKSEYSLISKSNETTLLILRFICGSTIILIHLLLIIISFCIYRAVDLM